MSQPSRCPHISSCEMFSQFKLSDSLAIWKLRYCEDDFERCARYQRTQLAQPVPVNLLPNGQLLRK